MAGSRETVPNRRRNPGKLEVMHALYKYDATGNDFLVLDIRENTTIPASAQVQQWCDRTSGFGADGVLLLGAPEHSTNDCSFRLLNADGSEAEMSGNGIRALAAEAVRLGIHLHREPHNELQIETPAGTRKVTLVCAEEGKLASASVAMGEVSIAPSTRNAPNAMELPSGVVASVGNPHWVFLLDTPATVTELDLQAIGPVLEHDPQFPERTNVEFIAPQADGSLNFRVWERGAGETKSCGTGATAAAAIAIASEIATAPVTVHVPGGILTVDFPAGVEGEGILSGPVELVGVCDPHSLRQAASSQMPPSYGHTDAGDGTPPPHREG